MKYDKKAKKQKKIEVNIDVVRMPIIMPMCGRCDKFRSVLVGKNRSMGRCGCAASERYGGMVSKTTRRCGVDKPKKCGA